MTTAAAKTGRVESNNKLVSRVSVDESDARILAMLWMLETFGSDFRIPPQSDVTAFLPLVSEEG